jgi:hypothetical protein
MSSIDLPVTVLLKVTLVKYTGRFFGVNSKCLRVLPVLEKLSDMLASFHLPSTYVLLIFMDSPVLAVESRSC